VAILLCKFLLEVFVTCCDGGIAPKRVTKLQSPNPLLAPEDDKVQMMSPPTESVPHEPPLVWQSSVELCGSLVAMRAQRLQQRIGLADSAHTGDDVYDRLRGETWNCGAADMFDCGETTGKEIQETIPLRYELFGPSRIVRHDADFFDDGLC
jgi:hypothetical protein